MNKMDAKEFLKTLNLPKNWSGEDEEYGQWLFYEKNVIEAMEQYHQSKVNNVVLDDVMKRFEVYTRVSWCKHTSPCFYVMEQKGKDVLICNTTNVEDENYNDWWVDYREINVL
jgi:hypothetical protein